MNLTIPRRRAWARNACRLGTLVSGAMLLLSSFVLVTGGQSPAGAATNNGALVITPTSGSSADEFTVSFASGAPIACPGDSATDGYRVQSFVVPVGTNLDGLTFNSVGPVGGGLPLIDTAGTTFVNGLTDITTGSVSQLPGAYTFQYNAPGEFAAGDWIVGIACTQGIGAGMTKSLWTTNITIATDASAGPAQITWMVSAPTTTTTDGSGTTTTTTDGSGTTTTTDGSGTTTTTELVINVGPPLVLSSDTLSPGDSVTIQASGWEPSSDVVVAIHSDPVQIGTLTADANGGINGAVTIPADTQPGTHQIAAVGLDPSGELLGSAADVTILAAGGSDDPTGGTPAAASPVAVMGQLPYTGSSPLPLVFWAASLLVFGRMAMLLGKRPKVVGDGSP
jgi:hypothetical protein